MYYAIILAAGKGTRMKTQLPKCAYPILREPMIKYVVKALDQSMVTSAIAVVGHQKEEIEKILGNKVLYAYQKEQLGTAHAVMQAKEHIKTKEGYTLIMCGDMPFIESRTINETIMAHITNKSSLTVISTSVNSPTGYGRIIRDETGDFIKIVEESDANDEIRAIKEINTGLYCVSNDILFDLLDEVKNSNSKKEYYLTDIVQIARSKNLKVNAYKYNDSFMFSGINDLVTLSNLQAQISEKINLKHMENGVGIVNPSSVVIGKDVIIAPGTIIYPNTMITGDTIIGANCIVGPNSDIHNTIIGNNSKVEHSIITDSKIGNNTNIGPFARLRMNCDIKDNVRIGNFVEIKKSVLDDETKAAHLTYIGDTVCGKDVNWGCGTVTINYDGINKHQTIVKDGAFIGCNTNIIAPVTLGENSMTAAGSTITESIPAEGLGIERAPLVIKEEYAIKYRIKKGIKK